MELVTTAFKIAIDERYKELKSKLSQIEEIIEEFKINACKAMSLLETYNVFSGIIVKYWPSIGDELAGRVFDLLFKDRDLSSKISAPVKVRTDYFYSPEEDF
ncbi:MAG: hypothetical protein HWN65_16955 [Candidatus Helarchaeota archaeon]|nr:hypothetical protein [Candidatus Helarchaeota archaeon]